MTPSQDPQEPQPKACETPHTDQDLVHCCIVRADLTPGQMLAQTLHAAGESAINGPVPDKTVALALAADDQGHLLEIAARLRDAGIPHTLIAECDGELMAIGVHPTRDRKALRRVTGSLALAGRDFNCVHCDSAHVRLANLGVRYRERLKDIEAMKAEIAELRLPWWKRLFKKEKEAAT